MTYPPEERSKLLKKLQKVDSPIIYGGAGLQASQSLFNKGK
jgi:hypothetical protein